MEGDGLVEPGVERTNRSAALARVERKGGSPGVDGLTVEDLPGDLKAHWPAMREAWLAGRSQPQPGKRVELPKPGGGVRKLGIPPGLARFIQHALLQVLQPAWDGPFSDGSDGVRPGRSAHHALAKAQHYLKAGDSWVVARDREKVFDRVNHDQLMSRVKERVTDRRVWQRIARDLKAGALTGDGFDATPEGTPQGGPWSPLLANRRLAGLDREWAKRGHRFGRYADACHLYVRSARAGARVLARVTRYLKRKRKLVVNVAKSAVARPGRRTFVGFSVTGRQPNRRQVSVKALKAFKQEIRRLTQRTRGISVPQVVQEARRYVTGWCADVGWAEATSVFKEVDSWVRRRLRCYLWKPWGRRRYRELRHRGVSRDLAWNTPKSAHGPWRVRRSPALTSALPGGYFDGLGVPRLYQRPRR